MLKSIRPFFSLSRPLSFPSFSSFFLLLCLSFSFTSASLPLVASSAEPTTPSAPVSSHFSSEIRDEPLRAALVAEDAVIYPGRPFWVAVHITLDPQWHAYWKNPGVAGMAPVIEWNLPVDYSVGRMLWPTPKRLGSGKDTAFGYEDELVLLVEIFPPALSSGAAVEPQLPSPGSIAASTADTDVAPATIATATLDAVIRWVVCSDTTCLPGESALTLKVPVAAQRTGLRADSAAADGSPSASPHAALFQRGRAMMPRDDLPITVKHQDNLLELCLHNLFEGGDVPSEGAAPSARRTLEGVDFFPEHREGINYAVAPLLQADPEAHGLYTVIIEGSHPQDNLRGILVLHTSTGDEVYAVDAPVSHSAGASHIAAGGPIPQTGVQSSNTESIHAASERGASAPLAADPFAFQGGVPLALLLALCGGLLLNLMPCVLPVLSFKVLGFIKLAGESRRLVFQHGLAFSGGVILSFWVLATLLLALQAYGRAVGWGFQLQEPLFVAILAAVIFLFGLNLFGVFEMGTSLMSAAAGVQKKSAPGKELWGSFFSGILATAVATPCTGPFLGSAVGFAVTLPPPQALAIFTSLGLGMSSPYLILAAFPSLLRFLPRPGAWMVTFKELMGFLMMASVLWLVWVFSAQTSTLAVVLLLAGLFFFALAGWVYGRWATPLCRTMTRRAGTIVALCWIAVGGYTLVQSTSDWVEQMSGGGTSVERGEPGRAPLNALIAAGGMSRISMEADGETWEPFSPEAVEALRARGIPVFIDFTAKWCLICQTNHAILIGREVREKFAERGVVLMKADWTKRDDVIAAELRKFGRNSVPLYVFYDGDSAAQPQILPQVLTTNTVLELFPEGEG